VSGQAIDLRSHAASLRRSRRALAAAAAAGLLLGLAAAFARPVPLRSTTLVLLSTPSSPQGGTRPIDTQVAIATSFGVSRTAGAAVRPARTVRRVASQVTVDAPTDQLLRIEAAADRAADAQALSQAVADAYLAALSDTARAISEDVMTDLRKRQDDLTTQVKGLQTEIDATTARLRSQPVNSVPGRRDAQLLAQLRAGQADLSLQLDKVKDQLVSSRTQESAVQVSATVIQRASPAAGVSLPWWFALHCLVATGGAVLAAGAVLLVRDRRDRRLRLRDEIADAVGSRVVAGIRSHPAGSVAAWSALLAGYEPDPVTAWALRQAVREAVPARRRAAGADSRSGTLGLVAFSGDERGVAVAVQLAAFASSLGLRTLLVPAVRDGSASALWAACARRAAEPGPGLLVETARPPGDGPDDQQEGGADGGPPVEHERRDTDLTVLLAVVDPREPELGPVADAAVTMLVISPGTATQAELATLAVALDAASSRVDGVIVADPEPGDTTTGRHTLGERARQAELPRRIDGPSPAADVAVESSRGRRR
jgi:hypothetical protein